MFKKTLDSLKKLEYKGKRTRSEWKRPENALQCQP